MACGGQSPSAREAGKGELNSRLNSLDAAAFPEAGGCGTGGGVDWNRRVNSPGWDEGAVLETEAESAGGAGGGWEAWKRRVNSPEPGVAAGGGASVGAEAAGTVCAGGAGGVWEAWKRRVNSPEPGVAAGGGASVGAEAAGTVCAGGAGGGWEA